MTKNFINFYSLNKFYVVKQHKIVYLCILPLMINLKTKRFSLYIILCIILVFVLFINLYSGRMVRNKKMQLTEWAAFYFNENIM